MAGRGRRGRYRVRRSRVCGPEEMLELRCMSLGRKTRIARDDARKAGQHHGA